jgi:hypothetical protein
VVADPIIAIMEYLTPPSIDLRVSATHILLLSTPIFVIILATIAPIPLLFPYTLSLSIVVGGIWVWLVGLFGILALRHLYVQIFSTFVGMADLVVAF